VPEALCEPGTPGAAGLLELIRLSATNKTLRETLSTDEVCVVTLDGLCTLRTLTMDPLLYTRTQMNS